MKPITAFLFGAIFFTACATATIEFPYKYFHISPIGAWDYPEGRLLGFEQSLDHKLSDCKPTRTDEKGNLIQECVVVFYSELNALVKDYKQTKQTLIDCQKGKNATAADLRLDNSNSMDSAGGVL